MFALCVCMCVCLHMCVCMCIFSDVLLLLQFRDYDSVYSNEIFSDLAKWPNIPIYIHTTSYIFKIWNYNRVWNNYFKWPNEIFHCFIGVTISRAYLVYLNEILLDPAKWPNISIYTHTSVHIFKIWNYVCFWNNIFRYSNDIFQCFVSLTISRTYFDIFEWDSVETSEVAKQSKCVFEYAHVCVCGYMFVFMCMFVCMCTHVCIYVYVCVCLPMFRIYCNLENMFRYIRMRFRLIPQSGQTVHVCAYVCACVCMCVYVCMYVFACVYVYICV